MSIPIAFGHAILALSYCTIHIDRFVAPKHKSLLSLLRHITHPLNPLLAIDLHDRRIPTQPRLIIQRAPFHEPHARHIRLLRLAEQRRAARSAEAVRAGGARAALALPRLDRAGGGRGEGELVGRHEDVGTESAAGEELALGAVAEGLGRLLVVLE